MCSSCNRSPNATQALSSKEDLNKCLFAVTGKKQGQWVSHFFLPTHGIFMELLFYRPFSYCIDQAGLGAFTAKSGHKHYNPPSLTVMWMNFDSPNFPSLCLLSAIISFQTCSNKCILYVLLFHKCIKIKYKTVNMYGVFLWLVQSSSRWNTIHSHDNYHVQLLSVRVGEFCHPARSQ